MKQRTSNAQYAAQQIFVRMRIMMNNEAIKDLIDEVYAYGFKVGADEKTEPFGQWYYKISEKYSVTYRNQSNSSPNKSDEENITDAELVSKIEDVAVKHGHGSFKWSGEVSLDSNQFENFTTDIVKLFKTYINPVSEPVKPELDNYIDQLRIRDLKQVCESHRLSITDSYEQGMYNGLELALSIVENRVPVFAGKTVDRKGRW